VTETRINGATYKAQHTQQGVDSCAGCAASNPRLPETKRHDLCRSMPPCQANLREDGRAVIWVKA
jgi:hypothetical protein